MPYSVFKEVFEPLLPSIVLALFGSVARYIMGKNHTLRVLIGGLIVSGFAGAIASLLLVDVPISLHTKVAIGGMAGFMGNWFLDIVAKRIARGVETAPTPWNDTERKHTHPERKD